MFVPKQKKMCKYISTWKIKSPELHFSRDISMPSSIGRVFVIEFDIRWNWLANDHWNLKRSTCEWQCIYFILFRFDLFFVKCERKHLKSCCFAVTVRMCAIEPIVLVGAWGALIEILVVFCVDALFMMFSFKNHHKRRIFYAFWQRSAFKCIKYFDNFRVAWLSFEVSLFICAAWRWSVCRKTDLLILN